MAETNKAFRPCCVCGEPSKLQCSRCHAPYCCADHQKSDWKRHKPFCESGAIHTMMLKEVQGYNPLFNEELTKALFSPSAAGSRWEVRDNLRKFRFDGVVWDTFQQWWRGIGPEGRVLHINRSVREMLDTPRPFIPLRGKKRITSDPVNVYPGPLTKDYLALKHDGDGLIVLLKDYTELEPLDLLHSIYKQMCMLEEQGFLPLHPDFEEEGGFVMQEFPELPSYKYRRDSPEAVKSVNEILAKIGEDGVWEANKFEWVTRSMDFNMLTLMAIISAFGDLDTVQHCNVVGCKPLDFGTVPLTSKK